MGKGAPPLIRLSYGVRTPRAHDYRNTPRGVRLMKFLWSGSKLTCVFVALRPSPP